MAWGIEILKKVKYTIYVKLSASKSRHCVKTIAHGPTTQDFGQALKRPKQKERENTAALQVLKGLVSAVVLKRKDT